MEESRFFTEYTVLTEDKDYQKYVRQLLADYWKYISLKMTGEDGGSRSSIHGLPCSSG